MGLHSKFSPSKLPRIVRCPGSFQTSLEMEQGPSSSYAEEGTMLHKVTEDCITNGHSEVPSTYIRARQLTQEHVDAVNDCLDFVFSLSQKYITSPDRYNLVETQVSLVEYADEYACDALADVWGTLDYSLVVPSKHTIHVVDWKFGKGVEVFPTSEQLYTYALGKLKNLEFAAKFDRVFITVGQPRLYSGEPFKTLEIEPKKLLTWLRDSLVPALNNALSLRPSFAPSEKACMWCQAKVTCEYRQKINLQTAQDVFSVYATLPQPNMSRVTDLLTKIPDLKKYMADIELYAMDQLKKGIAVPGYKLVPGRSVRKWKNETEAKQYLETLGYDEFSMSEVKFKSAPKVEKILGKKLASEQDFKDLIIKPEGKPTLVPESDKRKTLVFKTASETFNHLAET